MTKHTQSLEDLRPTDLNAANDALDAKDREIERLMEQNQQMRAALIHIEPRCEYVGCEKPGPHCTHSEWEHDYIVPRLAGSTP